MKITVHVLAAGCQLSDRNSTDFFTLCVCICVCVCERKRELVDWYFCV